MSSPIPPTNGPLGSLISASPAPTGASGGTSFQATLHDSGRALAAEAILDAPPPEVLEEIAAAGRTNEQMIAKGQRVCFSWDEQSGRTAVELRDENGSLLKTLSISETLDIATGKPLS